MSPQNNYQKFICHLRAGGLFYAFFRGIKYFIFLLRNLLHRRQKIKVKQPAKCMIMKGCIKAVCSDSGINIYWNDVEVTGEAGLNVSINTLGLWTDSTKADWQILDRGEDNFKVRVIFKELPLNQIWVIKIIEGCQICLDISTETEEWLCINEFRVICQANSRYKAWIRNFQQEDFPRPNNYWQDLCLDNIFAFLIGVRFPREGKFLPSLALERRNGKEQAFAFVQKPPSGINAHIIGFRQINLKGEESYCPGRYHLFSGRINLFEKDNLLDQKIENLRQSFFKTIKGEKIEEKKSKRKLKALLANFPWQKEGKWGVRAGSRWPHIKDRSENNYLPFPFFLAYAASLLKKNNIEVNLIDAIAEAIPESEFLESLSRIDFDILVIETSVPSFYYDMGMLKKAALVNIPVILCGPHPEIYKTEFLAENNFVDFVLFGEYEFTLLELVKAISCGKKDFSSVNGLIWRDGNNKIIKNLPREPVNIDNLPWPYRDGPAMEKYWDLPGDIPHPSVQMLASRGCPFSCNFCLWPQLLYGGRNYRARNVKDVVDEMEFMVRQKGFKSVYFDDDTFNVGKQRIIKLCDEIIKRGLHNIPWAAMAKADLMDKEMLAAMKKAGLHAIKYGVENASQELLDNCGKCLDLKKAKRMIEFTKSLGIKIHLTFLFGLEGETKETIKKTIDYSLELAPDSVQYSILTPFPGTEIFKKLDREGRIITKNWSLYDGHYSCVFRPKNLSASDLETAKQYAYKMWAEEQRKKRGFLGNAKKFLAYWQNYTLKKAFKKTRNYLSYVYFKREKFIGKI